MTCSISELPAVYALDPLHPDVQSMVQDRFRLITCDEPDMAHWHEKADAVIVRGSGVSLDDLSRCKRLKWVQKHGVGTDQLDVAALRNSNVGLMNTPGANVGRAQRAS